MKPPEEGEIQSIFKSRGFHSSFLSRILKARNVFFGVFLVKHKTANIPAQVVENTQNIK